MKYAEKGAFTLMLMVIPVVPNGYAGSKIKMGLCLEWKRGFSEIFVMAYWKSSGKNEIKMQVWKLEVAGIYL